MAQNDTESQWYTKLPHRGLLTLSGKDVHGFLQDLITNDMNLLHNQSCLYACLLTPQGKFLHDFFISTESDKLLLDCEGGERASDLERRLNMYRLRKDVQIESAEENDVYAILPSTSSLRRQGSRNDKTPIDSSFRWNDDKIYPDPRHPAMGYRSFTKPEGIPEKPFEEWDKLRITLTIPDGSRDLIPEKSTMDEGRMDQLNAVDYKKGCYVGQELTARMHYRGLGKKHLQTVDLNNLPEKAELRSSCGDIGIILSRNV